MSEQGRGREGSLVEAVTRLVIDVVRVVDDVRDLMDKWREERGKGKGKDDDED